MWALFNTCLSKILVGVARVTDPCLACVFVGIYYTAMLNWFTSMSSPTQCNTNALVTSVRF